MSAGLWKTHSVDALNQSKSPMPNAFGVLFGGPVSGGSDGLSPRDQTENSVDSAAQPRAKIPSWYHRLHQSLMSMDDSDDDDDNNSSLDDVDGDEKHPDRPGAIDDVPIDSRSSLLASNGRAASVDADIHLESTESSLIPRRQRFAETPSWRRPLQQRSESVDVLTGNGLTVHVGGRQQQTLPFSTPSRTPLSSAFRYRQHELSERQRTFDHNDPGSGVGQPADKWSGQQQLQQQGNIPVTKNSPVTANSDDVNVSDNVIVNYSLTSSPPLPDSQPPDVPPSSFMSLPRRRHRQSIDDGGETTDTAQQLREIGSQHKENDSSATACDDGRRGPTADIAVMETCTQTEREITDSTSDVLKAPLQQFAASARSDVGYQTTSQIVVHPQPTLNETVSSDVQTGSLVERAVASKPVLGLRIGRQLPLSPAPVPEKSLFQPQRSISIEQLRHTNHVDVVGGDKSKVVKATDKTPVIQGQVNVTSSKENSTMVRVDAEQASATAAVSDGGNKSSSMTNLINKWMSLDAIDTTGYDRRYGGIPRSYAATDKLSNGPAKGPQQPPETKLNGSTSSWDTRPSDCSAVAVKSVTNVCANATTVSDESLTRNQSAVVPSTASGRLTSLITQPKKQYKWTVQEAKPLGRLISASQTSTASRILATSRPSTPSFAQTLSDRQATAPAAANVYYNGGPSAILTSAPVPVETVRFQANALAGAQRDPTAAEVDVVDYQQPKGIEERTKPTSSVLTAASPGGAGNDVTGRGNATSTSLTPGIKTVLARFKSVEALSTNQSLSEASIRATRGLPGRTTIQTSSNVTPYLLKSRSVENVASRQPMTVAVIDNENYNSDPYSSETESKTLAPNDLSRKVPVENRNVMSESDTTNHRSIITPYAQIQLQKFRSMEEIPSATVIKRPASAAATTKTTAVPQSSSAVDARDDNIDHSYERRVPTNNVDSLLSAVALSAAAAAADGKRRQRPQSAGAARITRGGSELTLVMNTPAVSPSDGEIGRMTSIRTSADTGGRSAARQWSPIVRMASSDWSPYSPNTAPAGGTNDLQRYINPPGSGRPHSPLVLTDGTRKTNASIGTALYGGQTAAATRQPTSGGRVLPRRPDELRSGNVSAGYRPTIEGEAVNNLDRGRSPTATIAATTGANERQYYGSRPTSLRSNAVDRTFYDSRRSAVDDTRLNSGCTDASVGSLVNGSTNSRYNAAAEYKIVDAQPQTFARPNFSTTAAVDHQPQLNQQLTNNPTASPSATAKPDATPSWTQQRLATRSGFAVVDVADGGRPATNRNENSANEFCKPHEQERHLTNDRRLAPASDVLDTDETGTATSSLFVTLQIQPTCGSPSGSTMTSSARPMTPSYLTTGVASAAPPPTMPVSNSVGSIRVISTLKLNKSNAASANY